MGLETGNTDLLSVGAGGALRRAGAAHEWRLLLDWSRAEWDGRTLAESAYGHLRHNYALGGHWFTLAFAQVQHEPFQRLSSRTLLGAGTRFDLAGGGATRASIGCSPMLEIEDLEGEGTDVRGRLSSYLRLAHGMTDGPHLDATVFVQPRLTDVGDTRLLLRSSARFGLGGSFSLVLRFGLTHDSDPPAGVESTDTQTRLGLSWSAG